MEKKKKKLSKEETLAFFIKTKMYSLCCFKRKKKVCSSLFDFRDREFSFHVERKSFKERDLPE